MALSGETVTVACAVVGGIKTYGLGAAVGLPATDPLNHVVFAGPPLTEYQTNPGAGFTVVPVEIWQAWLVNNAGSPFISSGAVSAS